MAELHDATALEHAAWIRAGTISPVELIEHYLARIERLDAGVGAFVTLTADRARREAGRAEQRVAEARRDGTQDALPPLLGVPIGIKDLYADAGVPMKLGSRAFLDSVPDWDEPSTALLRAAGTISLGKTNTPEFGLPCYTEPDPEIAPPARTPYDLSRSAGGSSGGAAAAVAAGLVSVAPGSDGGGSIRIPASVCGLVGLKTSRGRVPAREGGADGIGLGVHGPLARTVRDAAALLDAIARPVPGDLRAPGETFLDLAGREPRGLRIGRFVGNILDAPVDPECVAAWESASALLSGLGHEVEDVHAWFEPEVYARFETVWRVSAFSMPLTTAQEAVLRPVTTWLRDLGRSISAVQYGRALAFLRETVRGHLVATARYDALLTPTLAQLPAPVGGLRDDADPAGDFDAQGRFTPYTASYNLTGQPALSLPLYWTAAGLPVGIQLVGRPGEEGLLLALGAQLEAAAPPAPRPSCWA
jgi:amidase